MPVSTTTALPPARAVRRTAARRGRRARARPPRWRWSTRPRPRPSPPRPRPPPSADACAAPGEPEQHPVLDPGRRTQPYGDRRVGARRRHRGRRLRRRSTSLDMPASNAKILTAVTALHVLGPDYRFTTDVVRRGSVTDGVLDGSLYLVGHGDPTTRQSDYTALAAKVRAAGITRITGKLVADGSFFDAQRYNPGWSTSYASDVLRRADGRPHRRTGRGLRHRDGAREGQGRQPRQQAPAEHLAGRRRRRTSTWSTAPRPRPRRASR